MNYFLRTLTAALTFFLFDACEAPQRGCLDIEATNLNVAADKPCEDGCCKYPNLIISVNQEYNSAIWKTDTAYSNDLGQWFRIKSVVFYLSDIVLTQQGSPYQTDDVITLKRLSGADTTTQVFTDDFLLIRRTPVDYTVGAFRRSGVFEQVDARLGLTAAANTVLPSSATGGHPLAKQNDSLWLNHTDRYVMMQIIMTRDTNVATTPDTLRFTQEDLGADGWKFTRTVSLTHEVGFDFNFDLTLDYFQLFKGVDLASTGISQWKAKIVSNLNNTFVVSQ